MKRLKGPNPEHGYFDSAIHPLVAGAVAGLIQEAVEKIPGFTTTLVILDDQHTPFIDITMPPLFTSVGMPATVRVRVMDGIPDDAPAYPPADWVEPAPS